jgi:aspartate racemase
MATKEILGVLGGMGPLASAEFAKTIYERTLAEREQDSPIVFMLSDPTFADRTQALLAGADDALLSHLIRALDELRKIGATKIVICCVTIHQLLPRLPPELRARIISLLDVTFARVAKTPKRHLLISTIGSIKLKIYERHPQWEAVKDRIIVPDEADQKFIHDEIIYQIKKNRDLNDLVPVLESLLLKYDIDSFIVGCTEIHLLAKQFVSSQAGGRFTCIDPLTAIAEELRRQN